jgi:RNA ligase
MNTALLNQMIAEGYVVKQKHPSENLFIYNYTQAAQYERVWNEVTLMCRGLIMDEQFHIIARPFTKFFNLGEQENQAIPNESFEVYEKMDGSLGILYWANGQPAIATRGSFASKQAEKATEMLHTNYAYTFSKLDPTKTYLFEIIYPENRIVVNYGGQEELVLLAITDNLTGKDAPLEDIGFPLVKRYDGINSLGSLKALQDDNKEGFVIKFESGVRYKVKFDEYVRIHRIVTQVSSINIWEYLKENQPLNDMLERVPDEFFQWVRETVERMQAEFAAIEATAKAEYKELETRKDTALYFMTCKYPQVMFAMLDEKDHAKVIWKMLEPEYERPFQNAAEEG